MQTITVANTKGGVGKTTIVCTMAALYLEAGWRTHLIDFDPQNHIKKFADKAKTIYGDLITCTSFQDLSRMPGSNLEAQAFAAVDQYKDEEGITIIDVAGNNNDLLTVAISESQLILAPLMDSDTALEGAEQTIEKMAMHIRKYRQELNIKFFWTGGTGAIFSNEAKELEAALVDAGYQMLGQNLMMSSAFKNIRKIGQVPKSADKARKTCVPWIEAINKQLVGG